MSIVLTNCATRNELTLAQVLAADYVNFRGVFLSFQAK